MLTPEWLLHATDRLDELYGTLETSIMEDMARRVAKIGYSDATDHQRQILQEVWGLQADVDGYVADYRNAANQEIGRLYVDAATRSLAYDDAVYQAAGKSPVPLAQSPRMMSILLADAEKTKGTLLNLTRTTASQTVNSFMDACMDAWSVAQLQTATGAMDYITATKQAVKKLAESGVRTITYVKGDKQRRDQLDVATRRAVLTGVGQTVGQLQMMRAMEMGCEYVEVTAHMDARPDHAVWQGQVYRLGDEFESATGYGTGPGLCGWNCRHSFYPFFPGISARAYTDAELDDLANSTVRYRGEEIGQYEASQIMRGMERDIRAVKREITGLRTLENIESDNPEAAAAYRAEAATLGADLKRKENALKDLKHQTGLSASGARTQVHGFGHSEASRAVWDARKAEQASQSFAALIGARTSSGVTVTALSEHFAQRATERSISVANVLQALQNPLEIGRIKTDNYGRQSQKLIGEKATVAINTETGNIVTVHATRAKTAKKLLSRKEGGRWSD